MIKVYGKIQTLKNIRTTLSGRGLFEFNSIGEINAFLLNYDSQVRRAKEEVAVQVASEQEKLEANKVNLEQELTHTRDRVLENLLSETANLQRRIDDLEQKESSYTFLLIVHKFTSTILRFRQRRIESSCEDRIKKATAQLSLDQERNHTILLDYINDKAGIVERRTAPKLRELNYTKGVLEEINPLIAGAIGETMVEEEVKNLSVNGVLLNDFSVKFNPPIYNKKERDRIYSIQIDHLLVTSAGVFLLETKNWSKESIARLDLRSPIDQIRRFSYAVFVLVNKTNHKTLGVKAHHWGKREIPIRSVIVMIGHKPKEIFQYVTVKTLNELNSYIEVFDPIFDDEEVNNIASYLQGLQRDYPDENIPRRTRTTFDKPVYSKKIKRSGGRTKSKFGVIILYLIIILSIGAILYFQPESNIQNESINTPVKKEGASSGIASGYFIVKENCPTYTKANIKSSISGYLVAGNEIFVTNINQFKYFYPITDKNGRMRYVKKECLRNK